MHANSPEKQQCHYIPSLDQHIPATTPWLLFPSVWFVWCVLCWWDTIWHGQCVQTECEAEFRSDMITKSLAAKHPHPLFVVVAHTRRAASWCVSTCDDSSAHDTVLFPSSDTSQSTRKTAILSHWLLSTVSWWLPPTLWHVQCVPSSYHGSASWTCFNKQLHSSCRCISLEQCLEENKQTCESFGKFCFLSKS